MRIAWIDASAGASGDMLLGALVDAGVPLTALQAAIDHLELGIRLRAEDVRRSALGATKVHVDVPEPRTVRHLPDILALLGCLPPELEAGAGAVFQRLGEAEAAVHRVPIEQVHFHEVGALDCIADIVGVVAGFAHLDVGRVVCSQVALGGGSANSEHGRIPVPVPAVLELIKGKPATAGPAPFESTTPTGAALLVSLADEWAEMPSMVIESIGSGAGTRDSTEFANVVRLVLGESAGADVEPAVQFDANVDDLDPRVWPVAIQALLDAGASDAWVTPITMKKGRPAFTVSALCTPASAAAVRHAIFEHTSTIGLREYSISKHVLNRWESAVEVDGQHIGVKFAAQNGTVVNRSVEWDDVAAAAVALGRPANEVLQSAIERAASLDSY